MQSCVVTSDIPADLKRMKFIAGACTQLYAGTHVYVRSNVHDKLTQQDAKRCRKEGSCVRNKARWVVEFRQFSVIDIVPCDHSSIFSSRITVLNCGLLAV